MENFPVKKKVIRVRYSLLFLMVLSLGYWVNPAFSEQKEGFTLEIPYQEGKQALQNGNYDFAVESFRKVLFVDGTNARAQYYLAEALYKGEKFPKAYKEYKRFLKNVGDDKTLGESERVAFVEIANERMSQIEKEEKSFALFGFFEINIFILTILLTVAFIVRLMNHWVQIQETKDREAQKLKGMFVDAYWERQQEKEITGLPFGFFTVIMFCLLIGLYFLSFNILRKLF